MPLWVIYCSNFRSTNQKEREKNRLLFSNYFALKGTIEKNSDKIRRRREFIPSVKVNEARPSMKEYKNRSSSRGNRIKLRMISRPHDLICRKLNLWVNCISMYTLRHRSNYVLNKYLLSFCCRIFMLRP